MSQDISYTFNLEEWQKKSRKPFKIQKTWTKASTKAKPNVSYTAEAFENVNEAEVLPAPSPLHMENTSFEDQISSESYQQQSATKSLDGSSIKKSTPGSRELKGILENMPSLRRSPLPAHRRIVSGSSRPTSTSRTIDLTNKESEKKTGTSRTIDLTNKESGKKTGTSRTIDLTNKESGKKTDKTEKQKLLMEKRLQTNTRDDKVVGKKRKLLAPSSSNAKRPAPTAQIRKATSSSGEGSEPVADQVVDLWTCNRDVQRKKNDLNEIDVIMSSLRDTGEEIFEQCDSEVEKSAIHQVVKKSLESLWKLIKHSITNKNAELELKQLTSKLSKSRTELLAKGKERNKELMKLSELQYKTQEVSQYQEAGRSKDVMTKFRTLKQNLPTLSE